MSKKVKPIHLLTEAGEALQADPTVTPWNTYPRPQLRRDSFFCLNGVWKVQVNGGLPRLGQEVDELLVFLTHERPPWRSFSS